MENEKHAEKIQVLTKANEQFRVRFLFNIYSINI